MKKVIKISDLKGLKITDDIRDLLEVINRKGDICGRYFSSWWFDMYYHPKGEVLAMDSIIFTLVTNYAKANGVWYNNNTECWLKVSEVAGFIAPILNVWSGTVIKWMRGMYYRGYKLDINTACGLDSIHIKINA